MTETRRNPHRNVRRKHFHLGAINDVQASSPSTSTDVDMTFSPRSRSTPFSIVEAPKHGSFLVALDFGTALTSVSYFKFDAEQRPSSILTSEVKSIMNWPSSPQHSQRKAIAVPSESWYLNGEYLWGYQVRKKVKSLTSSSDGAASESIIRFSKLLLSDRGQLSEEVEEILDRMGKDNMSVIKDYLSEIFLHTRNQLEELENFCEQCHLELTLCVPSGWRSETMFRLTKIVDEATTETGLRGSSFDFFIIEEPEAAATLALNDDNIRGNLKTRETFVVCDAGGGTVDTITYRVKQENPFRFKQVVPSDGSDCGSSYVNRAFIPELKRRLEGETYLKEVHQLPLDAIIERYALEEFEFDRKTEFDILDTSNEPDMEIMLAGLRKNESKGFELGKLLITSEQMMSYFRRSLDGTTELVKDQLLRAERKNVAVKLLLLVGGFSSSPALRNHLKQQFPGLLIQHLNVAEMQQFIVSHGGVIRALNKEAGPSRLTKVNIGYEALEEIDPTLESHSRNEYRKLNELTGIEYVPVVNWVIRKGMSLVQKNVRIPLYQVFNLEATMEVSEKLYFSEDYGVEDHYHPEDAKYNKGAKRFVEIEADFSFLRDENVIEPVTNSRGVKRYHIEYELVLVADGRNMKALICFPRGTESCYGYENLNLAFAYSPGTA